MPRLAPCLALLLSVALGRPSWSDPVTSVGVTPRSGVDGVRLSQVGQLLAGSVAPAVAVLDAFALDGDSAALSDGLARLADPDRLLALGALGTALSQRYALPGRTVTHGDTLTAAATWLRGEAGPAAGSCTDIHDTLRRLARGAGWRESVTLQVAAGRDRGHVITAVRTGTGWALLDYGTVVATHSGDFSDVLALASAWSGRLAGDVAVAGRSRLARFETAAGAEARAFLDHDGAEALFAGVQRVTPARPGSIAARATNGLVALDAGGPAWSVGAGVLGLGADGLDASPAVRGGGRWLLTGARGWVDLRGTAAQIGWRWEGDAQPATLGAASLSAGTVGRLGRASWRLGLAAEWLADLECLPRQLRGAEGDPFWWLLRGGPGASLTVPLVDDLSIELTTLGLVERTVVEPRSEAAGFVASWWRTEAAVGGALWRVAARSTWEPLTWTHEATASAALTPRVRASVTLGRTWSRRSALVPASDHAAIGIDWTGRAWSAGVAIALDGEAGARFDCRIEWRW